MQANSHNRKLIETRLQKFEVIEQEGGVPAAVALIISQAGFGASVSGIPDYKLWQSAASLLLTKRAAHLKHHAGQWALPGGRVDQNESLIETALRETSEEIGFKLSADDYLGRLDDYKTRTGYVMSGLVFWGGKAANLTASPAEVESIHRIPVAELMRADAPMLNYNELPVEDDANGQGHPVLRMPVGTDWIAAPTAALLYQFREVCLCDRQTRVNHYEQPTFAWK